MDVGGVRRLCELEVIKVVFWRNGMVFGSLGFMEYSSRDGRRIVGDLIEGYYPHILKKPFPEGVLMKVVSNLT